MGKTHFLPAVLGRDSSVGIVSDIGSRDSSVGIVTDIGSRDSSVGIVSDIGSRDSSVGIVTDIGSRDSSVGTATRYGLDVPGIESRWGRDFRTRPDHTWGPSSLLYNGYRVSFPEVKRPVRGVDHPPSI